VSVDFDALIGGTKNEKPDPNKNRIGFTTD
jgi:hypothetical protein